MADTAPAQPATTGTAAPGTAQTNTPGATTNTGQPSANRGLPYYEKLRRDLRDALQKKRLMDRSMAQLEDQIFRFEQSYLEETTAGNIIKGFDNYIKGSGMTSGLSASGFALPGTVGSTRRKAPVTDTDRVFSRSSAAFMRDSPAPSSAQTTPSNVPTPASYNGSSGRVNNDGTSSAAASVKGSSSSKNRKKSGANGNGNGNRDKDEDVEDGDKPPTKRLKISYGRD